MKDKPLIGILWMTATMRRQYELFGGYICLDMMKRGINKLLWPYAAVAMYDDKRNICIACEGILCGERYDMYEFMASFLHKNAPGRRLTSVDVVAGDGFFTQEMIHRLGFSNAHFITDRWHLVDSGLVQKFGLAAHELLNPHLMTMVNANSEIEYEAALQAAHVLLASLPGGRNGEWSEKLDQFASERKTYASYCLNSIQGSREIQGSSASESNHSSVLAFLNEGNKSGNSYCESPITLIRDLMKRQKARNQTINKRLFGESQLMKVERDSLARLPPTHSKENLLLASKCLCYTAYERYKTNMHRTIDYQLERCMNNESSHDVLYYTVKSTRYPDAPPRILHEDNSFRCSCEKRITEQDMCVHEVVAFGFRQSFYQPRHMFRENITGSVDGWVPQDQSVMDSILEYETEPLEDHDWFACDQGDSISNVDGLMASIDGEEPPTTTLLPPAKAIQPLNQKEVQNRMNCLIAQYSKMSHHDKFNFCAKLIDFEKECGAGRESSLVTCLQKRELCVAVPSAQQLRDESKKRKKPRHEKLADKAKQQINKTLQRSVLSQTIADGSESIIVNGKASAVVHCKFCNGNHRVNSSSCKRRTILKGKGKEYGLTIDNPLVADEILQRVEAAIPFSMCRLPPQSTIYQSLPPKLCNNNFVIHEATPVPGMRHSKIEGVVFRVSFLDKEAEYMQNYASVWVSGGAMKHLVTHKIKKVKYVFDETVYHHKEGWVQRGALRDCKIFYHELQGQSSCDDGEDGAEKDEDVDDEEDQDDVDCEYDSADDEVEFSELRRRLLEKS